MNSGMFSTDPISLSILSTACTNQGKKINATCKTHWWISWWISLHHINLYIPLFQLTQLSIFVLKQEKIAHKNKIYNQSPHLLHHEGDHIELQQLQQGQCKHPHHYKYNASSVIKEYLFILVAFSEVPFCSVWDSYLDARWRAAAVEQFISCSAWSMKRMSSTRASRGFGL